jgi:hypothetical protein
MTMTIGLFEAHVREMESIRAERVLDAARAAGSPYQKEGWWDALITQAQGAGHQVAETAGQATGFVYNGTRVGFDALYSSLSRALGGGVSH